MFNVVVKCVCYTLLLLAHSPLQPCLRQQPAKTTALSIISMCHEVGNDAQDGVASPAEQTLARAGTYDSRFKP